MSESIEPVVRQIVASLCDRRPDQIDAQAELGTALGIDSMSVLVLRESLERAFSIVVRDADVRHLRTVAAIVAFVEKRRPAGASVAAAAAPSAFGLGGGARTVLAGSRLGPDGVLYTDLDVGMPLTGRNGLAEGALVREIGHLRWQHLTAVTGVPSAQIVDEEGTRLYPTFFFVEVAFPSARPMGTYGENDRFTLASTLGSFGRSLLDGEHYLLPVAPEGTLPAPPSRAEDALAAGIPYVRLSNSFVAQWQGAGWLKRSRPANPGFERLREIAEPPDSYEQMTRAKEHPRFFTPPETYVPLTPGPVTVQYQLVPDRDLNGAGLVYFANYPVFLDIAERRVLGSLSEGALPAELLDRRTLVHRKSAYFSNATQEDVLDITVDARIDSPFVGAAREPDLVPVRLLLDFTMTRRSDARLMMASSAKKVVLGKTLADSGLLPFLERARG